MDYLTLSWPLCHKTTLGKTVHSSVKVYRRSAGTAMASAESASLWGLGLPQWGPGTKPLVRGQGRSLPEAGSVYES